MRCLKPTCAPEVPNGDEDGGELKAQPELTAIPAFQVDAVVEVPLGAAPASCAGLYGVDETYLAEYYAASASPEAFWSFVRERIGASQPIGVGS